MRAILLSGGLAVVCSLLGTWVAIGWFARHGFGQPIRDDGPITHHVKRGTPTMGGLVILASATAAYLVSTVLTDGRPSASVWLVLLLLFGCGVVGFLDDFIKVYTQNNQGLSSRAKMAGQTLVALGFGFLATRFFADERGVRPASSSYISTTHDWGIKLPLIVVLLVSVLLQMGYYKLTKRITGTGRRIFRIAPIHHHFEHLGWDEVTVVIRFWIIAGICVATGLAIFYASWLA